MSYQILRTLPGYILGLRRFLLSGLVRAPMLSPLLKNSERRKRPKLMSSKLIEAIAHQKKGSMPETSRLFAFEFLRCQIMLLKRQDVFIKRHCGCFVISHGDHESMSARATVVAVRRESKTEITPNGILNFIRDHFQCFWREWAFGRYIGRQLPLTPNIKATK